MSEEKVFADGFIAKRRENAPDFVLCNLSVKVEEAIAFLQKHQSDGWVNLDVKVSKGDKPYVELDTWRPTQGTAAKTGIENAKAAAQQQGAEVDYQSGKSEPAGGSFEVDDIPF